MSRANKLLEATEEPIVSLTQFIKAVGRNNGKFLIGVEGYDDVTFLQTMIMRIAPQKFDMIAFENLGNKGNVLEVHKLVLESKEIDKEWTRFVVDRDFDDLRGYFGSDYLWMTPTYSIENFLVSSRILRTLLAGEFRCVGEDGMRDLDLILDKFNSVIDSYKNELHFANLCIYHCVNSGIKTHPHDDVISPHIVTNTDSISFSIHKSQLLSRMPKTHPILEDEVIASAGKFDQFDPVTRWRGKFILKIFVEFLSALRKDRGSKTPQIFTKKVTMRFNAELDPIRTLSAIAEVPECLGMFVEKMKVAA